MSGQLEARQEVKREGLLVNTDNLVCNSNACNTYDVETYGLGVCADDDACKLPRISSLNAVYSLLAEVCDSPSNHYLPNVQDQQDQHEKVTDEQIKRVKHLQVLKHFTSHVIKAAAKIGCLKRTQIEITRQRVSCLMSVFLKGELLRRKKKTNADSIEKRISSKFKLQSPNENLIKFNRRKQYRTRNKFYTKNALIDMLLKIKLTLKSYIDGAIMKSRASKKMNKCDQMCYGRQSVTSIFNYIFPYRCSSSDSIEETSDAQSDTSSAFSSSSTIILSSYSSTASLNNQQVRHQAEIGIELPIVHIEPFVRHISMYNMYKSDNVLIRHLNIDTKTNCIKKLRRNTLKRHHKRIKDKLYKQNFNKKYQTYFVETSYQNQGLGVSSLMPLCRQAVGIGSTWDCNIDFGQNRGEGGFFDPGGMTSGIGQAADTKLGAQNGTMALCPPGFCTANKCDPRECYKRLKDITPYGSHASTQSKQNALGRGPKGEKNGEDVITQLSSTGPSLASPGVGTQGRQKVRFGSKTSFNINVYRETPIGAQSVEQASNKTRQNKALIPNSCRPGMCDPKTCKPSECNEQLKAVRIGTLTDPKVTGCICGTHVGTQSRKVKYQRTGIEPVYKDRGVSSKPQPKLRLNSPGRQAVRIGSKCSFNIEFYRNMPQNALITNQVRPVDSSSQQKLSAQNPAQRYQCEPGFCIPGQCNANECFKQLKSGRSRSSGSNTSNTSKGTSQGSQASSKPGKKYKAENSTFYRDKSTFATSRPKMSRNMPNRQAVRIGSKCSFNIEFYRSMPERSMPNRSMAQNRNVKGDGPVKTGHTKAKPLHPVHQIQCDPGVCIPGKCNANECFIKLKSKQNMSGSSLTSTSNAMTQASQSASNKRYKKRHLRGNKASFYKDQGVSSMPVPKNPLHRNDRQAVRIASNCSFNIEFYKALPQNAPNFLPNSYHQGDTYRPVKHVTKKQKAGNRNISGYLYECPPGACRPGKCNAIECLKRLDNQRLTGTPTNFVMDTSRTGSSIGSYRSVVQSRKPNRQTIRIGSNLSFNVDLYKNFPKGFAMSEPSPEPVANLQNYDYIPSSDSQMRSYQYNQQQYPKVSKGDKYRPVPSEPSTKKIDKARNLYECEPGICIPGKCNARECIKHQQRQLECKPKVCKPGKCDPKECLRRITGTDTSKTDTKKIDKARNLYECEPGICIPGKCNARECIKHQQRQLECKPKVCKPGKCDPKECLRRITGTDTSQTDTSYVARGSQASKEVKKKKKNVQGKATFFKDTGASSMQRHKTTLHMANRQAVRIGSTCSFNIEFYKHLPYATGKDMPQRHQPRTAVSPGPTKDKDKPQAGKKIKPKRKKLPSETKEQDSTVVQDVKIKRASSQQSDLSDTQKSDAMTTSKSPKVSKVKNKERVRDQSETSEDLDTVKDRDAIKYRDAGTRAIKKKPKRIKQGVSIGADNVESDKGFERLKNKEGSTSADVSVTTSSKQLKDIPSNSGVSKSTRAHLDRKEEAEKVRAVPVQRSQSISTDIVSKNKTDMLQLQPLQPPPSNKTNVVRVGSKCSINIQFYKEKPMSPSQAHSFRMTSIPQKSAGTNGFMSFCRKCCKFNKGATATNALGFGTQSQARAVECLPGLCDFNKCFRDDCPARLTLTDAGIGTRMRNRVPALPSYNADAATQSRRFPMIQQAAKYQKAFNSAICKCCGNFRPNMAPSGMSNIPFTFGTLGTNMDDLNGCRVREQAVILGSGCGFNLNYFRKPKK